MLTNWVISSTEAKRALAWSLVMTWVGGGLCGRGRGSGCWGHALGGGGGGWSSEGEGEEGEDEARARTVRHAVRVTQGDSRR